MMRYTRYIHRVPLFPLLLCLTACSGDNTDALVAEIDAALERGSTYLLQQQHDDGQWRSTTYGIFKDGPSLTPHVMTTLMVLKPTDPRMKRGVDAIAGYVDDDGRLTVELVNPVYSAAECSWVMLMAHDPKQMAFVEIIRQHQFHGPRSWPEDNPLHGGWTDAPQDTPWPTSFPFEANVSATLFGVGALKLGGVGPGDPTIQDAAAFTRRRRNPDGGFHFSTEPTRNKAGLDGKAPRPDTTFHSYGSATADALRILLAAGYTENDPVVAMARTWLVRHFDATRHPGTFNDDREVLRDSYYFYWCWSASHAMDRLQQPTKDWAPELARALIDRQNADGSFTNRFTDGKEDDPLVATPLALAALRVCRDRLLDPVR